MGSHYIKTNFRTLARHPFFSCIHIGGLGIGISCCILMLLYVSDEMSFDRFHKNGDRIYQLTCHRYSKTGEDKHFAIAAMVQGPAFKRAIPEIQSFVRLNPQPVILKIGNQSFTEKATWTDTAFFNLFSFPLLRGNPTSVLKDNHSITLSEAAVKKYFGLVDPVGKTVELEIDGVFRPFIVRGIAKNAPPNSSIQFSLLVPFSYLEESHPDDGWMWVSYPTYFRMDEGSNLSLVETKMNRVFKMEAATELSLNMLMGYTDRFEWGLEPFSKMHLQTLFEGNPGATDPIYVYLLTLIALFILGIACINFINLSIAQSMKRSREVGLRKVIGALRAQLIWQFLTESAVICALAFGIALGLTFLLLPWFNELAQKKISFGYLLDPRLLMCLVILFICIVMAAGFYPAWVLSGVSPLNNLTRRIKLAGKNYGAGVLVGLQFGLASLLIICTLFIYRQFDFLTKTYLGYSDKNLLQVNISGAVMDPALAIRCKTAFAETLGVERVSVQNVGKFGGKTICGKTQFNAVYLHVDDSYIPTLEIPLVAGRNFLTSFPSDTTQSVLVNETFVKQASLRNPIGSTIDYLNFPGWGTRKITIIGVVRDYHFESLREKIKPLVLTEEPGLPLGQFLIRINPGMIPRTLRNLAGAYHRLFPFHPFEYVFKKDLNSQSYSAESKMKKIIGFGALITIWLSAVGLFGLTSLSISQRTKEIAIRKLLGSGILTICLTLTRDFIGLVIVAFGFAIPASWMVLNSWLQHFAYKINLSPWVFSAAGIPILMIAMLTVGIHSIRAARMNPTNALRTT